MASTNGIHVGLGNAAKGTMLDATLIFLYFFLVAAAAAEPPVYNYGMYYVCVNCTRSYECRFFFQD